MAFIYYTFYFLFGVFISGLIIEWTAKYKLQRSYIIPFSIEIVLMLLIGFSPELFPAFPSAAVVISFTLLFAMGLKNACNTRVSQSVVRTTHLTGLFTDLVIELSLFFSKTKRKENTINKAYF